MELKRRRVLQKVGPLLTFGFFCLIAYLLYQALSEIKLSDVKLALTQFNLSGIAPILLLVLINFLILGSFDMLGLRYLGVKDLHTFKIYWSSIVCNAFTLNLGAFVGGLGLRYRIYRGWDVPLGTITKLIMFSTLGNWIGHVLLVSITMIIYPEKVQALTALPKIGIYSIGALGSCAIILYFILCFRRTQITFKSEKFVFPPISIAFLQLFLSLIQWTLLALIINILITKIGAQADFYQILFTYLLTGIAGVLTHIPAGLGVHETIFLRMNLDISPSNIIAVLIAFRLLYYQIPLMVAAPGYFILELYQKKRHLR